MPWPRRLEHPCEAKTSSCLSERLLLTTPANLLGGLTKQLAVWLQKENTFRHNNNREQTANEHLERERRVWGRGVYRALLIEYLSWPACVSLNMIGYSCCCFCAAMQHSREAAL